MSAAAPHIAPREHFLDWLRIAAFGLLVPYHAAMYFVSWDWHLKSAQTLTALEPWMRAVSPWRMDLLFIVSGAATSFMLLKRAAGSSAVAPGWLRGRARRLLLPLLVGLLLIVPPQAYFEVVQRHAYDGSYVDFMRLYVAGPWSGTRFCRPSGACLILPTWNHLWYLPYLFTYTLLLWAALRRWPGLLDSLALRVAQALRGAGLYLLPLAYLVLTQLLLRRRFPDTHALVDDWFLHAQYLPMFVLGAALARQPAVWDRMAHTRHLPWVLALLAWGLLLAAPGLWGREAAALLRPLTHSTLQWCALLAVIGFARVHWVADHRWRAYLSDAVFPVYILHQSITIVLAMALRPLALSAWLELPLLIAATFALSLLGYEIVRRIGWLRPGFGLKAEPAGFVTRVAAQPAASPAADQRPPPSPNSPASASRYSD